MKYTDEEIIQALECCIQVDTNICDTCPLYDKENGCLEIDIRVLALDLAKRLKAENKKLKTLCATKGIIVNDLEVGDGHE